MWKYQCKMYLLILTSAFVIGAIIIGALGYEREILISTLKQNNMDTTILNIPYIYYVIGGVFFAGVVNGIMLSIYLVQRFAIPFIAAILGFMLLSTFISVLGALFLLPCVIVALYGWITIPNRGRHKALSSNNVTTVAEVERVYRLHHTYLEEYEGLGKKAWGVILKMNITYAIALVVLILLILNVKNIFVVLIGFVLYSILFMQLTKMKNQALQPIVSLLYDKCNPEACASAIFALSKKARKKRSFPMAQQLAQCMIYLNDPHLTIDILATCSQNKGSFIFTYHSLMAYAYYQLGDESMVTYQYELCEKAGSRVNGPMQILKDQFLEGIQNKLNLMNKNFGKSRTYYEKALAEIIFPFQKVDFTYYLGLMAFADRDVEEARDKFRYVVEQGGSIYYVEKARKFLATIEQAEA